MYIVFGGWYVSVFDMVGGFIGGIVLGVNWWIGLIVFDCVVWFGGNCVFFFVYVGLMWISIDKDDM